ncbi:hypothetical protein JQK88_22385 [Mesorhizobium caraganae]|uniref:DUF1127 domain-containing protein n=1 Tax=Mesorhizobium caraganae TaxID=483206 RepID=UPI001784ACAB|nr:hypothetical protein [Mesorhizobium caraganae]MBM2713915.1 hypothetical protein [Mesorhizobium caraganae]
MKTMLTTVSELYDAVQLDLRQPPASATSRSERQVGLIGLIATWSERTLFREELALMARDTPELIDDIGLTMEQVEIELAKPFWRR